MNPTAREGFRSPLPVSTPVEMGRGWGVGFRVAWVGVPYNLRSSRVIHARLPRFRLTPRFI